jgi:hypothetical protein
LAVGVVEKRAELGQLAQVTVTIWRDSKPPDS